MKYLIIFIIRFILLILNENCTNNFEWKLENIPYISIEYIEKKITKTSNLCLLLQLSTREGNNDKSKPSLKISTGHRQTIYARVKILDPSCELLRFTIIAINGRLSDRLTGSFTRGPISENDDRPTIPSRIPPVSRCLAFWRSGEIRN